MKNELAEIDLKQIIKNVRIIKNEISDIECLSRVLESIIVDEAIETEIGDDQTILMMINKRFKYLKIMPTIFTTIWKILLMISRITTSTRISYLWDFRPNSSSEGILFNQY